MPRRVVFIFLAMLLVVASLATGGAAQNAGTPAAGSNRVDMVIMELRPADLASAGLRDFALGASAAGGGDSISAFNVAYRGSIPGDPTMVPVTNLIQGATLYLVSTADPGAPSPDRVLTSIYRYPDADAARRAYDTVVSGRSAAGMETSPLDLEGASGTIFIGGHDGDPLGAARFSQVSAVAVASTFVVEVAQEMTSGPVAYSETVSNLAEIAVKRARQVGHAPGVSLGASALDVVGSGMIPDVSRYIYLDGTALPQFGLSAQDFARQTALFEAYGTQQAYQLNVRTADDSLAVGGILTRHSSDDRARQYFQAVPTLLRGTESYENVRVQNALLRIGMSATLITYDVKDVSHVSVTELVVLDGEVVVEVIVNAPTVVSNGDMLALATAFTSCLDEPTCDPFVIPDDGTFGVVPSPATPAA